jgi:hypothetical protein
VNQAVEAWLADGGGSRPPRPGVRYVAHGVRPYPADDAAPDWPLLALAVGHFDGGCQTLDALLRDTTVGAVLPVLKGYGLQWLTEVSVDEVGYPAAQAWGYACRDLLGFYPDERQFGGTLQ